MTTVKTDVMSAEEAQRLKTDARLAREFADVKDREAAWIALELAEAQQERDALRAQLAQVTAERDALRARAELAEAERADALSELTRVTQERDAALEEKARESVAAVEVSSAHRRLVAQVEHLGAIVEGRTTPPSDEELAAHDGPWLVVLDHSAGHAARVVRGLDAQQHADRQRELRRAWVWHPVDERDGAIVAWPSVTPAGAPRSAGACHPT